MEPMNDHELNGLLQQWQAPGAPPHLRPPKHALRPPRWQWLMTGTIRIPVPIGLAAAIGLVAVWLYSSAPGREPAVVSDPPTTAGQAVVSLADFQPVPEAQLRVIGGVK